MAAVNSLRKLPLVISRPRASEDNFVPFGYVPANEAIDRIVNAFFLARREAVNRQLAEINETIIPLSKIPHKLALTLAVAGVIGNFGYGVYQESSIAEDATLYFRRMLYAAKMPGYVIWSNGAVDPIPPTAWGAETFAGLANSDEFEWSDLATGQKRRGRAIFREGDIDDFLLRYAPSAAASEKAGSPAAPTPNLEKMARAIVERVATEFPRLTKKELRIIFDRELPAQLGETAFRRVWKFAPAQWKRPGTPSRQIAAQNRAKLTGAARE